MQQFLNMAKDRCIKHKLVQKSNVVEAFKTFPRRGKIKVERKGEMEILRVLGDGNCQFRSLAIMMTGIDHEENQKKLRSLSVSEFLNVEEKDLKRSVFITHDERDCLTPELCKRNDEHEGAFLQASAKPYRRFVTNKNEFACEMSKQRVWGNEYTIKVLAEAMDLKVNIIQQNLGSYKVMCCYNEGSDCEVCVLFDGSHYEALVPSAWKLTGENSLQPIPSSDSDPESKVALSKSKRNKSQANGKIKAKKRKTSAQSSFNDWLEECRKKRKIEDTNSNFNSEDESVSINSSNIKESSGFSCKLTGERSSKSIPSSDSDSEPIKVLEEDRKKQKIEDANSNSDLKDESVSIHTSSGDEGNIESNHKESTGLSWKLTGESSSKSSPSSDSDSEPIKVPTKKKRKQSKLNEKKELRK